MSRGGHCRSQAGPAESRNYAPGTSTATLADRSPTTRPMSTVSSGLPRTHSPSLISLLSPILAAVDEKISIHDHVKHIEWIHAIVQNAVSRSACSISYRKLRADQKPSAHLHRMLSLVTSAVRVGRASFEAAQ